VRHWSPLQNQIDVALKHETGEHIGKLKNKQLSNMINQDLRCRRCRGLRGICLREYAKYSRFLAQQDKWGAEET